jgi:polar amino acid transport system substrate-binding protein
MPRRRALLAAPLALPFLRRAAATTPIRLFVGDVRPLGIIEGPRPGAAVEIVQLAAQRLGLELALTRLPFAAATEALRATPGALMTPIARNAEREALYTWVQDVLEVPQALGRLARHPPAGIEQARGLARIGVPAGGVQEGFLRRQGLTNIVPFATGRESAQALLAGEIDAWYATAIQIAQEFEALGQPEAVRLGPALEVLPVWLCANLDARDTPIAALRGALAALKQEGETQRIFRRYVPV